MVALTDIMKLRIAVEPTYVNLEIIVVGDQERTNVKLEVNNKLWMKKCQMKRL